MQLIPPMRSKQPRKMSNHVGEGLAPSREEHKTVGEGLAPSREEHKTVGEGLAPSRETEQNPNNEFPLSREDLIVKESGGVEPLPYIENNPHNWSVEQFFIP